MTLYEMTDNARQLYTLLESGEIDEEVVNDTLESMEVEDKLEDYCFVIRQFEAEEKMFDEEIKRMTARKNTAKRSAERLRARVLEFMQVTEADKLDCGTFRLRMTKSASTDIVDASLLPEELLKPQPPAVDKAAILKLLRAGEDVPGARLQYNTKLAIK